MTCDVCRRFARGNEDVSHWEASADGCSCPACGSYLGSGLRLSAADAERRLRELISAHRESDVLESRAALAIHEAGHATLHAVLKIGLTRVIIAPWGGVVQGARLSPRRRHAQIWTIAAGPVSENKFIGSVYGDSEAAHPVVRDAWWTHEQGEDYRLIEQFFRSPPSTESFGTIRDVTRKYVEEYWIEIVAVAWLLDKRSSLAGSLVRSVVGDLRKQRGAPIRTIDMPRSRRAPRVRRARIPK